MSNDEFVLKNGKTAHLFHSTGIRECPAVPLMLRVYADLIDSGFNIRSSLSFTNTSSMIWAECDGKVIGGICFEVWGESKTHWISLSFTDPEWRAQGINQHCHTKLEELTRDSGFMYVASLVNVNNKARIATCEKLGLKPEFYRMSKRII
jgi:GNAT superfamily N-acetyltransferase